MKTAYSNEKAYKVPRKVQVQEPDDKKSWNCDYIIPLVNVPDDVDEHQRKYLSVKRSLPVTAGAADEGTYDKYILRYDCGTPKRWLDFLLELDEVRTQLNLTTGPAMYNNFKALLHGCLLYTSDAADE